VSAATPGPWGIEQTRDMLWVGPMRPDGYKVEHVVVGLNIDSQLTHSAALRQLYNSRLIAAAPDMLAALEAAVECGMVPKSSAREGGATAHARMVHVADEIRAAIAKALGRTPNEIGDGCE
jgi:hypothetical protein